MKVRRPRGTRAGRNRKAKSRRPKPPRGHGPGGAPSNPEPAAPALDLGTEKDRGLLRNAARSRWPITPEKKAIYLGALDGFLVQAAQRQDIKAGASLINTFVAMEGQNQADEHLEIKRRDAADAPLPAPAVQQTTVVVQAGAQTLQERAARDPEVMKALMALQDRLEAAAPAPAHGA